MKKTLLIFACFLFMLPAAKAQLQAHAGRDTVWCSPPGSSSSPVLGAIPAATGGTMPYVYQWNVISGGSSYLSNPAVANPVFSSRPVSVDSQDYELVVTDNNNLTARDTVRVYFSRFACTTGECIKFKKSADTVMIGATCMGNLKPMTYQWSPATSLADPAAGSTKSWTQVSLSYSVVIKDRFGCVATSSCSVEVSNVGVRTVPAGSTAVIISPNPVTRESSIVVGNSYLNGTISICSVDGKQVSRVLITTAATAVTDILPAMAQGIYFYKIEKAAMPVAAGKIVIN